MGTRGDACHPDIQGLDDLGKILRRGFSLHRRVGRQDDFFYLSPPQTGEKLVHPQVLGTHPFQGERTPWSTW